MRSARAALIIALAGVVALAAATPASAVLPQQLGRVDLLTDGADVGLDGPGSGDGAGAAVAMGDVNGDGLADVIVGAPEANGTDGAVYVELGSETEGERVLGASGFRIVGKGALGERAGTSVAAVPDLNGDGRAEILVGARTANGGNGAAYVVFGKATSTDVVLGDGTTWDGFEIAGNPSGGAGAFVSAVGDLTGDGRAELVIGAPNVPPHPGDVYVVAGKPDAATVTLPGGALFAIAGEDAPLPPPGLDAAAGATDVNGGGAPDLVLGTLDDVAYVVFGESTTSLDLDDLQSSGRGFKIEEPSPTAHGAGAAVAGVGDMTGDGLAEVVIGAPADSAGPGRAYVVFGRAATSTVDLNALGGQGFAVEGEADDDLTGASVAPAGDVNGDGRPDIVVGASSSDPLTRPMAGSAYVVYGGPWAGTLDLGDLPGPDPSRFYAVLGAAAQDEAGTAVAGGGDFNGDGRPDVLVGTPGDDGGDGGAALLYGFGTPQVAYPSGVDGAPGVPIAPLEPSLVRRTGRATFSVSPPLPAGLSIDPATGRIFGAPVAFTGTTVHTVTMADLAGEAFAPVVVSVPPPQGPSSEAPSPSAPAPVSPPTAPPPTSPGPSSARDRILAAPSSGVVRVQVGGGRFVDLRTLREIPVGATVDATRGTVRMVTTNSAGRAVGDARFWAGRFRVARTGSRSAPLTVLTLAGGSYARTCGATAAREAGRKEARRRSRRVVRRLWGRGRGRFRTTGRYSTSTVRGTWWLTQDRCDGTLTSVREGVVQVFDRTLRRTRSVRARRWYRAPATPPAPSPRARPRSARS